MNSMQFWGVEVKAGQPLKVETTEPYVIHLSQAVLVPKKERTNDSILLSAKVGDKKIVLGTLSSDKFPQVSFDLVFEKDFELSHNGKTGSVHVCGYETLPFADDSEDISEDEFDEESEEEELPVENGNVEQQIKKLKAATSKSFEAKFEASNPKGNAKPSKNALPDESDEDDSEDEDFSEDSSMDGSADEEGMSEEDEYDESEDDDTPKKVETKKRPNESTTKTPVSSKKAKSDTPQKSDGKKAVHVSTPHPAKKEGKVSASSKQSPKSGGQFSCKSCDKSFGSDGALNSHSQAKHAAAK